MDIFRTGAPAPAPGPLSAITGAARVDKLFDPVEPARTLGLTVTFQAGACTAWHTHPLGQTLIVTAGAGWVQRSGGPVEEVGPGDVVWIKPGEKHWHGATATSAMTHIALQEMLDGSYITWMEPVTEEQYLGLAPRPAGASA
ncbi:MAG: cupin domain-containing protein [Rhodopila sp.]